MVPESWWSTRISNMMCLRQTKNELLCFKISKNRSICLVKQIHVKTSFFDTRYHAHLRAVSNVARAAKLNHAFPNRDGSESCFTTGSADSNAVVS